MWNHATELEWIRGIHTWRTQPLDQFFKGCNFFDTSYFIFLLIPCVWLFVNRKVAIKMLIIFTLSAAVNKWMKYTFDLPRPHDLDPTLGIITASTPGFPSGAAQNAVLMCGIILNEWKSDWKWLVGPLYLIIICFSRVYLGMHFPTDIIGGILIGSLLLFLYLNLSRIKIGALCMTTIPLLAIQPIDAAVYTQHQIQVDVPSHQLAPGSLSIQSKDKDFSLWNEDDHNISYRVMQTAAKHWGDKPFLVYGHELTGQAEPFKWEAVPYHQTSHVFSRYWQQLKVAINVIFGGTQMNAETRATQIKEFNDVFSKMEQQAAIVSEAVQGHDAFCTPAVIKKQQVLEGERVRVLYNYAPIGKEHFLVVPKEHRRDFRELTQEEYAEAAKLSQFVIQRLKDSQPVQHTYLFHKTGKDAGQTVAHWHMHLVITESQSNDWLGKIHLLWKMTFGSNPLNQEALAKKVQHFTEIFKS